LLRWVDVQLESQYQQNTSCFYSCLFHVFPSLLIFPFFSPFWFSHLQGDPRKNIQPTSFFLYALFYACLLLLWLLLFWWKVQAIWEVLQLQISCYSIIDLYLLSSFLLIRVSFSSLKLQSCYSHISSFFIRFCDLFSSPWVGRGNPRDLKTSVFLSFFHFNFVLKK